VLSFPPLVPLDGFSLAFVPTNRERKEGALCKDIEGDERREWQRNGRELGLERISWLSPSMALQRGGSLQSHRAPRRPLEERPAYEAPSFPLGTGGQSAVPVTKRFSPGPTPQLRRRKRGTEQQATKGPRRPASLREAYEGLERSSWFALSQSNELRSPTSPTEESQEKSRSKEKKGFACLLFLLVATGTEQRDESKDKATQNEALAASKIMI
jgi:hypothetical protein